eukprot:scaffold35602_cov32-Tisochrysis_lutea.AAC.1
MPISQRSATAFYVLVRSKVERHMDGVGLFRHISRTMRKVNLEPDWVVGITRDSCSTNGVACQKLLDLCPNAVDMLCVSHTLQHTGEHMELAVLEDFLTPWLTLISHTQIARTLWFDMMHVTMKGYSKIRRWSRWEVMKQLAENFGDLQRFVAKLEECGIGDATTKAMARIIRTQGRQLQLELALAMDVEVLCTTTYKLEGDGLEILLVYEALESIRRRGRTMGEEASDLPNIASLLRA